MSRCVVAIDFGGVEPGEAVRAPVEKVLVAGLNVLFAWSADSPLEYAVSGAQMLAAKVQALDPPTPSRKQWRRCHRDCISLDYCGFAAEADRIGLEGRSNSRANLLGDSNTPSPL
jgi:hypothetical protein